MAGTKAAVDDLWWSSKPDPETGKKRKLRDHGKGSRWRVRWIDPYTGATRTETRDRKPDAEALAASITDALNRGRYVDPGAGKTRVSEYGETWLKGLMLRQSTIDQLERNWRNHVAPALGHLSIGAVHPDMIRSWVAEVRGKGLSASTVHNIYGGVVAPLFTQAVIDHVIGRTPCVGIKLPELSDRQYAIPTPSEVHALTSATDAPYQAAVQLAASCGLRQGEIFGLERSAIDLDRREVHVRQQVVQSTHGLYLGPPKTKLSRRTVELPAIAAELLGRHIREYLPEAIPIVDRTDPDKVVERNAVMLFPDGRGQLMRRSWWSEKFWVPAIVAAGLPTKTYGLHSLRHFFATVLIHAGAHVKNVQLALGHAKASVTLDTYLGYWPDEDVERSRSLIDAALGTALAPSTPDL
ncbi:tyrosine-type recombinase/integrase [Saccharothrix lopnurensis]|uniref:Tyrosine-type recombinase/integrase n=1 Tax=Saccharothrix lopnurensis TaxID=1670621 RepID=A0ABW1P5F3_9PSEU